MADASQIRFTRRELLDLLPSGWLPVADSASEAGSSAGEGWQARVRDGADQEWELRVRGRDCERLGRLEALRRAIDRLQREALG